MPGFLYFIPSDRNTITAADLNAAGLGYASDGRSFASGPIPKGPGDVPGIILTFAGDGVDSLYKPDEQLWQCGGGYWVGMAKDSPPGETDLRRRKFLDGHLVPLGNKQAWQVPVARSVVGGVTLPRSLVLGPNGKDWILRELPEFVAICADAQKWWDIIRPGTEGGEVRMPFDEQMRISIAALQMNYRIGPAEASLLNLLTTDNRWQIMFALVDWPSILAASESAKKNGLAPA